MYGCMGAAGLISRTAVVNAGLTDEQMTLINPIVPNAVADLHAPDNPELLLRARNESLDRSRPSFRPWTAAKAAQALSRRPGWDSP